MIQFSNELIIYDRTKDRVGGGVISRLISEYPKLNQFLLSLDSNESVQSQFRENENLSFRDVIDQADENSSFAAQELRNDLAADLGAFLTKGLCLRSIDRAATTEAQERAIAEMEPTLVSVKEGEIILRKGVKVTAADLEKYQEYIELALEDSVLLPKRIFVTFVTLLLV